MKITVTVKPRARQEKLEQTPTGYTVWVREPPINNRANEAVQKLLARHFGVSPGRVIIRHGAHGKYKLVEIKIRKNK